MRARSDYHRSGGRILLLNRTGEEILGLRFADVRGKMLRDLKRGFLAPRSIRK